MATKPISSHGLVRMVYYTANANASYRACRKLNSNSVRLDHSVGAINGGDNSSSASPKNTILTYTISAIARAVCVASAQLID